MRALTLAVLALAALHSSARAEDSLDQTEDRLNHTERHTFGVSVGIGTMLDFDRSIDGTSTDEPTTGLGLLDYDSVGLAHEGSLAVALSYLYPLSRYAGLGLQAQVVHWGARRDYLLGYPRAFALDLSILPRAQLPIARRVTLIASVPFGLSVNFFDADIPHHTFREEASTGSGYNLGIFVGAQVALFRYLGVRGELGVSWHWLHHGWHYTATDDQAIVDAHEDVTLASTTLFFRVTAYLPL